MYINKILGMFSFTIGSILVFSLLLTGKEVNFVFSLFFLFSGVRYILFSKRYYLLYYRNVGQFGVLKWKLSFNFLKESSVIIRVYLYIEKWIYGKHLNFLSGYSTAYLHVNIAFWIVIVK